MSGTSTLDLTGIYSVMWLNIRQHSLQCMERLNSVENMAEVLLVYRFKLLLILASVISKMLVKVWHVPYKVTERGVTCNKTMKNCFLLELNQRCC